MMYKCFVVLLFVLQTSLLYSQNVEFSKGNFKTNLSGLKDAQKNILDGDSYFVNGKGGYQVALKYYLKANDFNPNNALLNYKIGVSYLHSFTKDKAYTFLKKAFELNNKVAPDIHYQLGMALQVNLRFDEAMEEFIIYKSICRNQKDYPSLEVILNKKIDECKNGFILVNTTVKGEIINLTSLNSEFPDYCPLISADENVMIFTSRRSNTTGGQVDNEDMGYYEDVYISHKTESGWSEPKNIGVPINTATHDATVGLSPDGQELYIYKGENGGDIHVCKLKGDKWSEPHSLPAPISSEFRESSASISSDGNTLYFVSDRDKNTGRDIYKSVKDKKGKWGDIVKLSSVINTAYDEEGVFIHPDNKTLYFSSKGHKSMGGYDVFYSVIQPDGTCSEPKNMGYPINTPDDDLYFTMSGSGLHGYFSSVRPEGKGDKDIYLIDFTETISPMNIASVTLIKGEVRDSTTGQPIEAEIEITDNVKNELVAIFTSNSVTGEYLISLPSGKNYGITLKAKDCLFHSENFDIPESAAFSEVTMNVVLNKINVGSRVVLRNIFFNYASDVIRGESFSELERMYLLLKENPNMRIEISGHTDNQSSMETNMKLSTARAKAVVEYLVNKGIDPKQMESKGYAYTQPIASNDTEEGKKQNRRVEYKILSK